VRTHSSISGRDNGLSFSPVSGVALGPNQPHVLWVPGALCAGTEAGHSPTLVARLGMCGVASPLPLWNVEKYFYLYLISLSTTFLFLIAIRGR
jgi:hypothetical protein